MSTLLMLAWWILVRRVEIDLEGRALEDVVGNGEEFFTVEGGGIFASNKALHDLLLTDIIRNRTVNDRD